jgi:hypothetical protein
LMTRIPLRAVTARLALDKRRMYLLLVAPFM